MCKVVVLHLLATGKMDNLNLMSISVMACVGQTTQFLMQYRVVKRAKIFFLVK